MKQRLLAGLMSVLMCLPSGQLLLASADSEAASMTTYATGAIYESPEEFEAKTGTEIKEDSEIVGRASTTLPSSFDVTTNAATKDYFPPIGNQGEIGSCAAWASTYYQFTYEVNRFKGEPTTADNIYSPTWTYNYINGGVDKGSAIADAYSVLEKQGAMKLADVPYNNLVSTYSFEWPTDITKMVEALEYRATVDSLNVSSSTSANFNLVKEKLVAGQIATVYIDALGWSMDFANNGERIIVRGSENGGGHNMTVVGYDDNIQVIVNGVTLTGAFKLANSWGDAWGNNGYIWVAYDALNEQSAYGEEWQSKFARTRMPIFETSNCFSFIDVQDCDVCFAGKIQLFTEDPWNLRLYAAPGSSVSSADNTNKRWGYKAGNQLSDTEKRFIVYDYFLIDEFYDMNMCLSSAWTTKIKGNPNYETSYRLQVLDSLGEPISSTTVLSTLTSTEHSKSISISLAKGRVTAYDNAMITHEDSEMVLNSLIDLVEFSNLQRFLADYNSDGAVTTADVIAMNNYIAAQNGETYSLTDYIDAWGCSLADVIEDEFDMTIEEYVTENYAELSAMDVIPAELEIRGEAYAEK